MEDFFVDIKLNVANLDRYYVRKAILNSISNILPKFHGELLDIGCGKMPYKNYILHNSAVKKYVGLDIETALPYNNEVKADVTWNGIDMPLENNRFDCAFGTEVLEHCPDPQLILNETYRVLKHGGIFFFTVPFLWPLHEVPHDEFRYTPFSLNRYLQKAGFVNIQINALGGWHASLAQMLGLWLQRSPMAPVKKKIASYLIFPVYKFLIRKDIPPKSFAESSMIPGLSGFAYKPSV